MSDEYGFSTPSGWRVTDLMRNFVCTLSQLFKSKGERKALCIMNLHVKDRKLIISMYLTLFFNQESNLKVKRKKKDWTSATSILWLERLERFERLRIKPDQNIKIKRNIENSNWNYYNKASLWLWSLSYTGDTQNEKDILLISHEGHVRARIVKRTSEDYSVVLTQYWMCCSWERQGLYINGDQHVISPHSNTAQSFIKIMRIKEMIANLNKNLWLLKKFS